MLTKRQQEIIDKSVRIIATRGIQGLTIKNLSKEIGISEPAIYRHFESKTDILLAILQNFKEIIASVNKELKQINEPAVKKIEILFSRIINIFIQTPSPISVIFSEEIFKNEKVLKNTIVEIMNENERNIEIILKEGQKKREIRNDIDHKILAVIVMGSLRFVIKQWDLKNQHENLGKEGEKLMKGLKKMLEKQ